ncbi:MAG: hypothetical protein KAV82_02890 [Phycisphaerae bacterium]|nr:hypothetical protein [Phycisphaerae bacterium]
MSTTTETAYCLICEHENPGDAVLCSHCYAPMTLIHDAISQNREPCIISVIGESNVGKTVYLGLLLDMLSKRAGDFEAVPKGAYSVNLQQTVISHLQNRKFPPKTPSETDRWHWAYYQVARMGRGTQWFDLVMPDMAGETLAAEVESPQTHIVIQSLLEKTAGCMVLIDAAAAAMGSSQPDLFGLKLMTYLDQNFASSPDEKVYNPVAVVLCKADYCPQCFDDPRVFAETNLNRVWNMCQSRFAGVEFFAASVIGTLGFGSDDEGNIIPIPLHTTPRGILEPFEWILSHLE